MKKVALFIATEKGYNALRKSLCQGYRDNIGCVFNFEEVNVEHSYHEDIYTLCRQYDIPYYQWKDSKGHFLELLIQHNITGAVTIAWKFLISLDINSVLEDNLIVFHDSLLPKYRGFSPTPTAIICGESEIGISALFATDEVDRGEIILQKRLQVREDEYIKEIIEKQADLCSDALVEIINKMRVGDLSSYLQDETEATYSIWRNPEDCRIEWDDDAKNIYNFIRAVGNPYPGAFTYYMDQKIIISKAELIEEINFTDRHSGKIWSVIDGQPQVICGKGMLKITYAEDMQGNRIEFNRVRVRFQ